MNFSQAERYLQSLTDYEKTPGVLYTSTTYDLKRMEDVLGRLGNPHKAAISVHVAGTKGKGSTTAMIASVLTAAGHRVGLYTSPHFHTIRERIRINGVMISESEFAKAIDIVKPEAEAVNKSLASGYLTTFEVLTAAAFVYFASQGVRYQALEVGLGGRLDATNVVKPEVCVITSISMDHMEVLGRTLEAIASEKAGIIKAGCSVVSAPQQQGVDEVIRLACESTGSTLIRVGRDVRWQAKQFDSGGQDFRVSGRLGQYDLRIPLLGAHQLENAACAVAALEVLQENGAGVSQSAISEGLANTRWPGRLQVIREKPWLICDGAHNADSAARLREAIKGYFEFDKAVVVLGTSSDKDITGIVRELAPICHRVIVTRSAHPRSASPDVLVREFARHGLVATVAGTTAEAVEKALEISHVTDLVCVTGSLFVAGEVLAWAGLSEA
ncbi:MAG: folylpolyglutamate synthase/dihydrofolate synthase family protein [Dehalococcoidia bacterium]|nr:folylpolyglutamate synthase/dihydrofolate synthase family protein [Dehalococcoidia bacterium]